jgi:hypothetical protein
MAQTRKKRKTKHRGNAAGMIEARGRTGRKPTGSEKGKSDPRKGGKAAPGHRLDSPPSWKGAAGRAAGASLIFFVALVLLFKRPPLPSLAIAVLMLAVYTPLGFYTDLWIHRRRMRRQAEKGEDR